MSNKRRKFNLKTVLMILFILVAAVGIIIAGMLLIENKYGLNDKSIDTILLKTKNSGSRLANKIVDINKYKITNLEELDAFYELNPDSIDIDKNYLKENTIFIQIEENSNATLELKGVLKDNDTLSFDVETDDHLENHGNDMPDIPLSSWYLMAVIPNKKIENLNLDDWKSPIDVKNSSVKISYDIRVEIDKNIDVVYAINTIENIVNNVGDIIIYSYNIEDNKNEFSLKTYDNSKIQQLTNVLNNTSGVLKVETNENMERKEEYDKFLEQEKKAYTYDIYCTFKLNSSNNTSDGVAEKYVSYINNKLKGEIVQNSSTILNIKFSNISIKDYKDKVAIINQLLKDENLIYKNSTGEKVSFIKLDGYLILWRYD